MAALSGSGTMGDSVPSMSENRPSGERPSNGSSGSMLDSSEATFRVYHRPHGSPPSSSRPGLPLPSLAVLKRLGNVSGCDYLGMSEVCYCPPNLEDAMERPGRKR